MAGGDTDLNAAVTVLREHPRALLETCAWITDPDTYSDMKRRSRVWRR